MMEFIHSPYSTSAVIVVGMLIAVYMACGGTGWSYKICGDFLLTVIGMIGLMVLIATTVLYFGRPF